MATNPPVKRKAFAYITSGRRILLLAHPDHPAAGIQVPAGTMRDGEAPRDAILRDAFEETGLAGLEFIAMLGDVTHDARPWGRNEMHRRWFGHLRVSDSTPERWLHWETDPDDAPGERVRFELFWASLDAGLPDLIAGHDALLTELRASLDDPAPGP